MKIGVAWYPEQHPPQRWPDDVRRMADAGLSLVRVGEFAWTALEPERGRFTLDWLDEVVGLAAEAGLGVVMSTPTAVPPVWLTLERPEILTVDADGRRLTAGSRKFTCPTSAAFRDESRRIAGVLAARYGGGTAAGQGIVAWQLDNEAGNHVSTWCWCDESERAFRHWLRARYGSIGALNAAWGTVFWSATYPSFEAVQLPRRTAALHSPSLLLAFRRFSSDQVIAGMAEQREIIAAATAAAGLPILANLPADELNLDPRGLARLCGAAAIDLYPHGHGDREEVAGWLDLAQGHTGRAWVMEHQPGPINWTPTTAPVAPGQVRLWLWRAALHGFEAFLFFSWRPTRSGSEQYHSGLLRHDGTADRGLEEAAVVAREIAALAAADPDALVRPPARVAVLSAVDDHWAIEIDPHRPGLTHRRLVNAAHAGAWRSGLEAVIVDPLDDLTAYDLVLAPALLIWTAERQASLERALAAGTTVVLGPRSLVADVDDCWLETAIPGGLAARLGARVVETFAWDGTVIVDGTSEPLPSGPWVDVLEPDPRAPDSVEILARFAGDEHPAGRVAAVRNGNLAYCGASSAAAWAAIVRRVAPASLTLTTVPAHAERFVRGDRTIVIDHDRLTVDGLALEVGARGG